MFFMFLFFLIAHCLAKPIKDCLRHCGLAQTSDEIEIDENLGNYFETLPNPKRKAWLATEVYNANKLGVKTFGTGTFEQLRTTKGRAKLLKNTPCYEILSNLEYTSKFQYVPI